MIENFRIGFREIRKSYGKNRVLENTALALASHDCIVVTGENGAGKSTLLRIVAGLEKPDQCLVSIDDDAPQSWRQTRRRLLKRVMYLHQQPYMLAGSLRRNLEYAAKLNPALDDPQAAVNKAIQWAGLDALERQSAISLSGGQQQRVALARARLNNPQILLLDEPTANLDRYSRKRTMRMLSEFRDSGTAVVIVTHDPDTFGDLSTAELEIRDRQIQSPDNSASEVVELDAVRQSQTK